MELGKELDGQTLRLPFVHAKHSTDTPMFHNDNCSVQMCVCVICLASMLEHWAILMACRLWQYLNR